MVCEQCGAWYATSWPACLRCGYRRLPVAGSAGGTEPGTPYPLAVSALLACGVSVAALLGPWMAGHSSGGAPRPTQTYRPPAYAQSLDTNQQAGAQANTESTPTFDAQAAATGQAQAIAALFQDMRDSRSTLAEALAQVGSCDNLAGAASALHQVVTDRASQLQRANALAVDLLSGGADLKDALVGALDASQQADAGYARWADTLAANGCDGQPPTTDDKQQADGYSQTATQEKARAAQDWDQIAGGYGFPTVDASQI